MSKKFAFLVHDPIMLVHYKDVWTALGRDNFLIITTEYFASNNEGDEKLGLTSFLKHINDEHYEVKNITEIINCGIKFKYVITNHVISGSTKEFSFKFSDYFKKLINRGFSWFGKSSIFHIPVDINTFLPLQVGQKQIRFMYGADISDGWSLQNWNEIYDVFLCHGVNDERELNKRFNGKTFVMGYPRYDRFFAEDIDLNPIRAEFAIDTYKKTVLWMPTLAGDYSSIPLFCEPLSKLGDKYNLVVRPHPFSFVQEKSYIQMLEILNFNIDRTAQRDMNELFGVADIVLVDNGGTPFSAIFLGKNLIFLDIPSTTLDDGSSSAAVFIGSSVMELKEYLPVISNHGTQQLIDMLESESFYKENDATVEMLFKKYFDSPRGGGAQRVAECFKTL